MALDWVSVVELVSRIDPLFRFVHGLTFFVLSFALLLLPSHVSRLEFSRRFPLLAFFGFCQAILAWDNVLASALGVEQFLPPLAYTLLTGIGYASLLAFGLLLPLTPKPSMQLNARIAIILPSVWLVGLLILLRVGNSLEQAASLGSTTAHLALALPGGITAALGLRREAHRSMDPHIYTLAQGPVRVAGGALGALGLLAALQPLADYASVPISILYAACGIGLTWGLLQALNSIQKEVERWIEDLERTQALATDRERISRDLHDGIIQSIYAAGLMLEGVRHTLTDDPASAGSQISRVMNTLNQSIQDLRRYIFDLRGGAPESDLESGLRELMRDFRVNTLLNITLEIEGETNRTISAERRGHVFQITNEALSNVARHARARKVEMSLTYTPDELRLRIADDGVGMSLGTIQGGHGLRNMSERTRLLEGTLDIDSAPKQGVTVTLTVPY
jgi:signal transduction histidine kinase